MSKRHNTRKPTFKDPSPERMAELRRKIALKQEAKRERKAAWRRRWADIHALAQKNAEKNGIPRPKT